MKIKLSKKSIAYGSIVLLIIFSMIFIVWCVAISSNRSVSDGVTEPVERNYTDYTAGLRSPFIPYTHSFIGEDDSWKVSTVQPVIVDFYERENSFFFIGQLVNSNNNKIINVEFFILGDYGGGEERKNALLVSKSSEALSFTKENIVGAFKIGEQIRIKYISKFGSTDIEFCNTNEFSKHICSMDSHLFSEDILESYFESSFPLYIYTFSKELEEE